MLRDFSLLGGEATPSETGGSIHTRSSPTRNPVEDARAGRARLTSGVHRALRLRLRGIIRNATLGLIPG
jgi:hypothetical protein